MKPLFLICLLLNSLQAQAQSRSYQSHITDPMITTRCKNLLNRRNEQIRVKQKAQALLKRNQGLLDKIPEHKQKAKKRLQFTHLRLQQELKVINLKIAHMTEDLVRKGCSGFRL